MKKIAAMLGKNLESFDSLPLVSVDGEEGVGVFLFEPRAVQHPEVVVFSHGLGCDAYYPLFGLMAQAINQGFKVLAFDLPGHGIQSRHRLDRESLESIFEAALAAGNLTGKPWIGVCYSMGAWAFALASNELANACRGLFLVGPAWKSQFVVGQVLGEARFILTRGFWSVFRDLGWRQMWPALGVIRRKRFPLRLNKESYPYPQGVVRFINNLAETTDPATYKALTVERWIYGGQHDKIALSLTQDDLAAGISTKHVILKETHWTLPFARSLRVDLEEFLKVAVKR